MVSYNLRLIEKYPILYSAPLINFSSDFTGLGGPDVIKESLFIFIIHDFGNFN